MEHDDVAITACLAPGEIAQKAKFAFKKMLERLRLLRKGDDIFEEKYTGKGKSMAHVELKAVADFSGMNFTVPLYQRGYR